MNSGFKIDNLKVSDNMCYAYKNSISIYQNIILIDIFRAYHFELTDSQFTGNEYFISSALENTMHVDINRV